MTTLARVQGTIMAAILAPNPPFAEECGIDAAAFARAIAIHRETCRAALRTTLSIGFPILRKALGEPAFELAANDYVDRLPPRSAWLEDYGQDFPAFLRMHRPALSDEDEAIGRIDAAVNRALHADPEPEWPADSHPIATLAHCDESFLHSVRLIAHPASQVLAASHRAARRWSALALDERWPAVGRPDDPLHLLVVRTGDGVRVEPITGDRLALLTLLQDGGGLGEAFGRHGAEMASHLAWFLDRSVYSRWTAAPRSEH